MARRITLNDNTMKKKNGNYNFENESNEKQNSLTSGIRIGLRGNFPIVKQKFVNSNLVHAFVSNNECCSVCSSVEKLAFCPGATLTGNAI